MTGAKEMEAIAVISDQETTAQKQMKWLLVEPQGQRLGREQRAGPSPCQEGCQALRLGCSQREAWLRLWRNGLQGGMRPRLWLREGRTAIRQEWARN